jgi:hypothetical protein
VKGRPAAGYNFRNMFSTDPCIHPGKARVSQQGSCSCACTQGGHGMAWHGLAWYALVRC